MGFRSAYEKSLFLVIVFFMFNGIFKKMFKPYRFDFITKTYLYNFDPLKPPFI